ncbi:MAG: glycerol-3-phosphate acyltransferase [Candidatus Lokiarchaeota archaeon]|nr:glycerol-3-phosphate acyltransferase [Candidatus Lokiarchaeota archaeon]
MNFLLIFFSSLIGYLLGSISFSRIFLKIKAPKKSLDDLQIELDNSQERFKVMMGSGANKASIILGTKWGIIIGILDIFKIIIPLILFRFFIFPSETYFLYVAAFGLIGHNWPIYYRFKGGRGHSVMLGSLIVIDWLAVVVNIILGNLLGFALLGSLVFASYLWLWMMIPWFLLRTFDINYVIYAILINIVAILSQIPEIKLFVQLRKEGKDKEYKEKLTEMTAQFRGLQKMEDFFKSLGTWRIVLGITVLIGTIIIYIFLPLMS